MGFFIRNPIKQMKATETSYVPPIAALSVDQAHFAVKGTGSDEGAILIDPPSGHNRQRKEAPPKNAEGMCAGDESSPTAEKARDYETSQVSGNTVKKNSSDVYAAASSYVSEHVLIVKAMAEKGPISFRVLSFLGGFVMLITSIFDWAFQIFHLSIMNAIVSVYTSIFGFVICLLEGDTFFPSLFLRSRLQAHASILLYVWGRGAFYFFAGSLHFSRMSFFSAISGGFMMVMGSLSIIVGRTTSHKLSELRKTVQDETALQFRFKENDVDGDGFLDSDDFGRLVENTGLHFSANELVAAFSTIDYDGDQKLSYKELRMWWSKQKAVDQESSGVGLV